MKRRFNPARGGHAPGHLRDWFINYVETGELDEEMVEQGRTLRWLFGQLWNCSDIMPGIDCDELDLPRGSTYARAVRSLRVRDDAA